MKNTLILLSFLFLGFKAQAQVVIPIGKSKEFIKKHNISAEDSIYHKDVNGLLDKYIGTWEGKLENKFYSFEITKKTKTPNRLLPNSLEDGLVIHFKLIDEDTARELYNKKDLPIDYQISLTIYSEVTENKFNVYYFSDDYEKIRCGDKGFMHIEFTKDKKLSVYVEPGVMGIIVKKENDPCPNGRILPPFPDEDQTPLILSKK